MSRLAVNQHPVLLQQPDWQQPFYDATLLCVGRGLKIKGPFSTFSPLPGETTGSSAIMIIVARVHSCYFVISVDGRSGVGREGSSLTLWRVIGRINYSIVIFHRVLE